MSEPRDTAVDIPPRADAAPPRPARRGRRRRRIDVKVLRLFLAVAAAITAPLYLDGSWLQTGLFAMSAAVAALGLTMLLGQAGQLSLGHCFFVAVGAYGYAILAGPRTTGGLSPQVGLGLPPALAAILAVALAGAAGLLFSPIAARLRGIYLGIASFALVFVGQQVLTSATTLTGGVNGRDVATFAVPGISFADNPDATLYIAGAPIGREARLWYLALAVTAAAYLFYRNVVRGRPGRALRAVRDRELMADVIGVPVTRYKTYAFAVSSMYAGLGGVLLALAFGRIVPDTFGVSLTIGYLAMVVIGGLGSAAGAVAGAVFVTALPAILDRYAAVIPGLAPAGSTGITSDVAAKFLYGAAVVALLLLEPAGAAGIATRLRRRLRKQASTAPHP